MSDQTLQGIAQGADPIEVIQRLNMREAVNLLEAEMNEPSEPSTPTEPVSETTLILRARRSDLLTFSATISECDIAIAAEKQSIREAQARLASKVDLRAEQVRLRKATEDYVHTVQVAAE